MKQQLDEAIDALERFVDADADIADVRYARSKVDALVAEMARDCERYRWLRDKANRDYYNSPYIAIDSVDIDKEGGDRDWDFQWIRGRFADAAIDAARAAESGDPAPPAAPITGKEE